MEITLLRDLESIKWILVCITVQLLTIILLLTRRPR